MGLSITVYQPTGFGRNVFTIEATMAISPLAYDDRPLRAGIEATVLKRLIERMPSNISCWVRETNTRPNASWKFHEIRPLHDETLVVEQWVYRVSYDVPEEVLVR